MIEAINKVNRANRQLLQELGRDPKAEEVATFLEMPLEKVQGVMQASMEPVSLDRPIGEDEDSNLSDFIEDDSVDGPADAATRAMLTEAVGEVLERAAERCAVLPQIETRLGNATSLEVPSGSYQAASCTQVLLYVDDVPKVLSELHRALAPGGRVAIVETDWRGALLHSNDDSLARTVFAATPDSFLVPDLAMVPKMAKPARTP